MIFSQNKWRSVQPGTPEFTYYQIKQTRIESFYQDKIQSGACETDFDTFVENTLEMSRTYQSVKSGAITLDKLKQALS